jgi:hypothetical protein
MHSLSAVISDMRDTRDVSRDNALKATHPTIKAIAETYAELLTGYILRLEEIKRMNSRNSFSELTRVSPEFFHKEL